MRRLAYSRQSVPLRHQNSPGGEGEDERVMKAIKGFARTSQLRQSCRIKKTILGFQSSQTGIGHALQSLKPITFYLIMDKVLFKEEPYYRIPVGLIGSIGVNAAIGIYHDGR